MEQDTVVELPGRGQSPKPGGAKSKPSPPMKRESHLAQERAYSDWKIKFYKKTGKKLTKKAETELSPIYLFNTPREEVARRLWRAENLRSNRDALLVCEVERFEGPKGWKPYPKEMLTRDA